MKQIMKLAALFLIAGFVITSCKKKIDNSPVTPVGNKPPVANAGYPQTIILPEDSVMLSGRGTDDDGTIVSYHWSKSSGPSSFVIADTNASVTKVKNLVAGAYEFQLRVTDNDGASAQARVVISVTAATPPSSNIYLIPVGKLSIMRGEVAVVTAGNKIYFAGGYIPVPGADTIPLSTRIDIYDLNTKTWSTAELREARCSVGAVVVGNKVLFAGGVKWWDGGFWGYVDISKRVEIYDISTNSWNTTDLPEAIDFRFGWHGNTAVVGNKAIFCGENPFTSSKAYMYDVIAKTWTTAPLSMPRSNFASASLSNKVLIAGNSGPDVDVYDGTTNSWTLQSLSANRGLLRAATLNDKAFFAGGGLFPTFFNTVDIYDNNTHAWSVAHLSKSTVLRGAAAAGQKMLFVSDQRIDIYDAVTGLWTFKDIAETFHNDSVVFSAGGDVYILNEDVVLKVQL